MILYSKTFREGLEDPLHGIYMYIPINKDILPINYNAPSSASEYLLTPLIF